MVRKFLVSIIFLVGIGASITQAKAVSLDLNQALLTCVLSEGECLTHTGIPFVDSFFRPFFGGADHPPLTDDQICVYYLSNWCTYNGSVRGSPYDLCRNLKKEVYKAHKKASGKWPSRDELVDRYRTYNDLEERYFDDLENVLGQPSHWSQPRNPPYFTCTPKEQYLWLKKRCGHTDTANKYRYSLKDYDHSKEGWDKYETEQCIDAIRGY